MLVHALGGPTYSFTVHGPEEFDKPESLHLAEKIRRRGVRRRDQLLSAAASSVAGPARPTLAASRRRALRPRRGVSCRRAAPAPDAPAAPRLRRTALRAEGPAAARRSRGAPGAPRRRRCELVLAGDGEMRAAIEALIDARRPGAARVRITGWISSEQVRDELLAARALVLPSFAEGLPVVIMEAMALRRPVHQHLRRRHSRAGARRRGRLAGAGRRRRRARRRRSPPASRRRSPSWRGSATAGRSRVLERATTSTSKPASWRGCSRAMRALARLGWNAARVCSPASCCVARLCVLVPIEIVCCDSRTCRRAAATPTLRRGRADRPRVSRC